MLPTVGDDGNSFLVVARKHTGEHWVAIRLKTDAVTDAELQHLRVSAELMHELEASNNSIIEVDQFIFSEFVDVDFHGSFFMAW